MRMVFFGAALAVSSCANADGNLPDPTHDFDCSLTTQVFYETSATSDADHPETLKALSVIHNWYATLVQDAAGKGASLPSDDKVRNMYLALGKDLPGARKVLQACVDRTKSDPGFPSFAGTHGFR